MKSVSVSRFYRMRVVVSVSSVTFPPQTTQGLSNCLPLQASLYGVVGQALLVVEFWPIVFRAVDAPCLVPPDPLPCSRLLRTIDVAKILLNNPVLWASWGIWTISVLLWICAAGGTLGFHQQVAESAGSMSGVV